VNKAGLAKYPRALVATARSVGLDTGPGERKVTRYSTRSQKVDHRKDARFWTRREMLDTRPEE
jgi:hypothetical protein